MRFILLIFSYFVIQFQSYKHPVHVSVTNVDYISAEQEIQFSTRFFTDDFETNLNKIYDKDLKIGTPNENLVANLYISDYLSKHLTFFAGTKLLKPKFEIEKININSDENTTTVFVRFGAKLNEKVSIQNTLMTDLYSDQKNLLIFTVGNKQMPYKFDATDTRAEFLF